MLREWATEEQLDAIAEALEPPVDWRDPRTGLPAGWSDDEADEWAEWERALRS